jgi:hypothetical protein
LRDLGPELDLKARARRPRHMPTSAMSRGLETQLKVDGDRVYFLVRTTDPLSQDRLVKMGWSVTNQGLLSRRLSNAGPVERIFQNFTAHLEEMIEQSARRRPIAWEDALAEFMDRVEGQGVRWWLYGSTALAVRGIDIQPGDLDLAVDDPWLVGDLLADLLVEPVSRLENWVADVGGRAFHGALIEWLAGAHPTGLTPPHEQEPAAGNHLEMIAWRGRGVPVPRLQVQLAVAERRGLRRRSEQIRRAMTR